MEKIKRLRFELDILLEAKKKKKRKSKSRSRTTIVKNYYNNTNPYGNRILYFNDMYSGIRGFGSGAVINNNINIDNNSDGNGNGDGDGE